MIEFDGVTRRVGGSGGRAILDGVTLRLTEPRVGLIGANGSGKSTLARMINGLVTPTSGTVRTVGIDVAADPAAVRRRVGFLFADPDAQILMPTPAQDVAFSLRGEVRRGSLTAEQADLRAREVLEAYGLAKVADSPSHELSGGEKQLLALAAVLVTDPEILVCDEPTTLLDLRNSTRVLAMLAALPQQVVLVTHHLDAVLSYDRVIALDEGRVLADGPGPQVVAAYRKAMTTAAAPGSSVLGSGAGAEPSA